MPFVEIGCGFALLLGVSPVVSGGVAAALLLSFLIGVSANLARGRQIDCHCFGSRDSEPLGWRTLVRLAVLLTGTALVIVRPSGGLLVPPIEPLPAVLLAFGLLLGLYMLRALPAGLTGPDPVYLSSNVAERRKEMRHSNDLREVLRYSDTRGNERT